MKNKLKKISFMGVCVKIFEFTVDGNYNVKIVCDYPYYN